MSIYLSRKTAQKIVDTVKDVCGHDINFINTDGIIFASTNEIRIGEFHEIGKKVIDTKEIIDLETNELDVELLSSEEIENMYKEDTKNANSI